MASFQTEKSLPAPSKEKGKKGLFSTLPGWAGEKSFLSV